MTRQRAACQGVVIWRKQLEVHPGACHSAHIADNHFTHVFLGGKAAAIECCLACIDGDTNLARDRGESVKDASSVELELC